MLTQSQKHAAKAADRFDAWAHRYGRDRIATWFQHWQSVALSNLPLESGTGFLDVGCGTGWAVRQAAVRLKEGVATGLDISPQMINRCLAHDANTNNIEFRLGNATEIPYPDESFSSIMCTCSFHHYDRPLQALAEIRRVLRSGGRFALLDSARDVSLAIWLQDRSRRYFERSHVKYYTTKETRSLVDASGLRILGDVQTFKGFRAHRKLFTGLMLVVCSK